MIRQNKKTNQHDQTEFLLDLANRLNTSSNDATIEKLYEWHDYQEQKYWPDSELKFEELWPEFRQDTLPQDLMVTIGLPGCWAESISESCPKHSKVSNLFISFYFYN